MERPVRLSRPAIAVHGGAGSWPRDELEGARAVIRRAVEEGLRASRRGGAVEMVVEAVSVMEDSGAFDAGVGSVLDYEGRVAMDAGVMRGSDLAVGAVAAVSYPRNPVRLAREVMLRTPHSLIVGPWADELARRLGLPPHPGPSERALRRWRELRESPADARVRERVEAARALGYGTVGAVAVDESGELAAAVSTGGVVLKLPGRVGDSPIPGAGFYATRSAAFAATGVGEFILRLGLSLRASVIYELTGDVASAVEGAVAALTSAFGEGTGGLIGMDAGGRAWGAYNTAAMPWAAGDASGKLVVL